MQAAGGTEMCTRAAGHPPMAAAAGACAKWAPGGPRWLAPAEYEKPGGPLRSLGSMGSMSMGCELPAGRTPAFSSGAPLT